jgi:hypothetical protein
MFHNVPVVELGFSIYESFSPWHCFTFVSQKHFDYIRPKVNEIARFASSCIRESSHWDLWLYIFLSLFVSRRKQFGRGRLIIRRRIYMENICIQIYRKCILCNKTPSPNVSKVQGYGKLANFTCSFLDFEWDDGHVGFTLKVKCCMLKDTCWVTNLVTSSFKLV